MGQKYYKYKYPHPAVTVDCAVMGIISNHLHVALIQRKNEPFKNQWALPGGFVGIEEALEDAVKRELKEELTIELKHLEQIGAFGNPNRDPRERVISVAYYSLIKTNDLLLQANDDALNYQWFYIRDLPTLAFDHTQIIDCLLKRLNEKIKCSPFGIELLPEKFKLSSLQNIYEDILGRGIDKSNFRKKLSQYKLLIPLEELEKNCANRPSRLYKFNVENYLKLSTKDISLFY
ncbi:MAG TPA: NUDIX domain-containing protein [Verrucomicrobiota bacterium]|mgnify:CR=1 FL=1|nr:NUDIX domain-containing protein [Verrucomicrobiota bacterium]